MKTTRLGKFKVKNYALLGGALFKGTFRIIIASKLQLEMFSYGEKHCCMVLHITFKISPISWAFTSLFTFLKLFSAISFYQNVFKPMKHLHSVITSENGLRSLSVLLTPKKKALCMWLSLIHAPHVSRLFCIHTLLKVKRLKAGTWLIQSAL